MKMYMSGGSSISSTTFWSCKSSTCTSTTPMMKREIYKSIFLSPSSWRSIGEFWRNFTKWWRKEIFQCPNYSRMMNKFQMSKRIKQNNGNLIWSPWEIFIISKKMIPWWSPCSLREYKHSFMRDPPFLSKLFLSWAISASRIS